MRPSMYSWKSAVLSAALTLTLAPAALGNSPHQCRTNCPKFDVQRATIYSVIYSSLPNLGSAWSVYCTPSSRDMRCWARHPSARFTRRFDAAVRPDGYSVSAHSPWRLGSRKRGHRIDGTRG